MDKFAVDLADALFARIAVVRGDGPMTRAAIRGLRDDLKKHPELVPDAIRESLDKNNLSLTPKG